MVAPWVKRRRAAETAATEAAKAADIKKAAAESDAVSDVVQNTKPVEVPAVDVKKATHVSKKIEKAPKTAAAPKVAAAVKVPAQEHYEVHEEDDLKVIL